MDSKPLGHSDHSGFEMQKRALCGDSVYAINADQIIWDNSNKKFYVFEYQKCEATQTVNPWTSHPNRYWGKCHLKYRSLWRITKKLEGTLFVINYADEGTPNADMFRVIMVKAIDDEKGITEYVTKEMLFSAFSDWFRNMNKLGKF